MIDTVSFFCGCGGLDLGFRGGFTYMGDRFQKNRFRILKAYDFDTKAIATYKQNIANHGEVKDLSSFDPLEIPAARTLIGGFPCQDFSTCGPRRALTSERGRLYQALITYGEAHRPDVIVGENVPGLKNINAGNTLKTIRKDIEAIGYKTEVWELYAPAYGVPQTRSRLIILAVRDDMEGFPVKPFPKFEANYRSIDWAIGDLISANGSAPANHDQYFKASRAKKGNGQGDETSKIGVPAYTVRANAKSRVQYHYQLERRLTIRECARIQTFPDDFEFPHSATTNLMQIGNAVPPVLGHAVARSIQDFLVKHDKLARLR